MVDTGPGAEKALRGYWRAAVVPGVGPAMCAAAAAAGTLGLFQGGVRGAIVVLGVVGVLAAGLFAPLWALRPGRRATSMA